MKRPFELRKALEALSRSEPLPHQVIVSDDSPVEDRRSEEVCQSFPFALYQRGPRAGLAANRNACILLAKGDWIQFIDDDVIVPVDFHIRARELLADADPREVILGGLEENYEPGTQTFTLVHPPALTFWGFLTPANGGTPGCVVINATLFPRQLFNHIRFDQAFRYGCEEVDITQAALRLGYHITVCSDLRVKHFPSPHNRSTYAGQKIVSRVYFGLKRQWLYRQSVVGTLLFATLGIPRILLHSLRKEGWLGVVAASRQSLEGIRRFTEFLYQPNSETHPAAKR